MPRATVCVVQGEVRDIDNAIELRDSALAAGRPLPAIQCQECGARVRTHRAGGNAAAHFERLVADPSCINSAAR